jgi:hypothetical protein
MREVLYVRIPISTKVELERIAAEYGVSLAAVTARAVEMYLMGLGVEVESPGPLP